MIDPLGEIVSLLKPSTVTTKLVSGAGSWAVRREETGNPWYCLILSGSPLLEVDGHGPLPLNPGDFVLIPAAFGFVMSGRAADADQSSDPYAVTVMPSEIRHGDPSAPSNAQLIVGHFAFGSPDAGLLVSLLPKLIYVRPDEALHALVQLVRTEARRLQPGRDVVLTRLVDVIMIEALRSVDVETTPGLVRGLADPKIAVALRCMHGAPERAWSVADLAREAAMSRSSLFDKFSKALGMAPMEYLLAWRMALAKNLLRQPNRDLQQIAEQVGYGSASTFIAAFTRFVGRSPRSFSRQLRALPSAA